MNEEFWKEYYENDPDPWLVPDAFLVEEVEGLTPGSALDLGCGDGGDSLWLASRGWKVTAVDFASAAISRVEAAAAEHQLPVRGVVADIVAYEHDAPTDLVFLNFIHLLPDDRTRMLSNAAAALAPGGTLLYNGISRTTTEVDIPGELLSTVDEIVDDLQGLVIERAEVIARTIAYPGAEFQADGLIVRARRPGR
jgi:SAM-dependent methyltransferase